MQKNKVSLLEINGKRMIITGNVSKTSLSKLKSFGNPVEYNNVEQVGAFSIDENRSFCNDNRNLKYFKIPEQFPNLSIGYEEQIKRDENVDEKLDFLLRYLNNKIELVKEADFIMFRGLLTKLMCIPYQAKEDFSLFASCFKGSIYLVENKKKETKTNVEQLKAEFYGRQFENMCSVEYAELEQAHGRKLLPTINTNTEYCVVVKSRLGENRLLLGAEVDCIKTFAKNNEKNILSKYVEIKTTKEITTPKQNFTFKRYKLLKYWLQSFLVKTETVFVGFRDNDGNVKTTKTMETSEMPKIAKTIKYGWDDKVCINFANNLLSFLKKSLKNNLDKTHNYLVHYIALSREIVILEYKNNGDNAFLTNEYVETLNTI